MQDYTRLAAWRRAHHAAVDVYRLTSAFPPEERYGLVAQLRRAAVSVSANIAEGSGRGSRRDFARFISIAVGSCNEIEALVLIGRDLGYLTPDGHKLTSGEYAEIRQMLVKLRQALQAKPQR